MKLLPHIRPGLYLACGLIGFASLATAEHAPTHTLETVEVTGGAQSLTNPSTAEAAAILQAVPGGTTLIDADSFRAANNANLQQVLSLAPGVYAQSRFGGGETRTSIRGSGISQTFNTRGIRFLMNGLPLSEADGNFRPQLLEPLAMRHVEVYRGANALPYGAAVLGGAVNFVMPTGHTASGVTAHMEAGSYGYLRPQISAGGVLDDGLDGYLSLSGITQDGFRPQSQEENYRLYGNLGYRFSDNSETRLHVSIQDNNLELPGSLMKSEVDADPRQANDFWRSRGAARDFEQYRFDLQHAIHLGGGDRLEFGSFYQRLDMHHPLPFVFIETQQNDIGFSLRHLFDRQWAGFDHHISWGGLVAWGDNDLTDHESLGTNGVAIKGAVTARETAEALTAELFAEDRIALTSRFSLVAGLQLAHARRKNRVLFGDGVSAREDYTGINPRLGFLYDIDDAPIQLFGNVSRSFEPPTNSEFADADAGVLDAQTATTIELGTRRDGALLSWELAVYHSWVDDEILTVDPNPPSGQFVTSNAPETTLHSGVELGFDARLPLADLHAAIPAGHDLRLKGSYTYNRFVFDGDPSWGDNDIPGIPSHFGRFELLYENTAGFYIGPTLEAASAWYVDFANTLEADGYWLVGARAGYRSDTFDLFLEGRNLNDRRYASNTGLLADASGNDAGVFNPGMPAAVFGGMELRF